MNNRDLINIVEAYVANSSKILTESQSADVVLYHATSVNNAASITDTGFRSNSYWAIAPIANYYAEGIEDDDDDAVVFAVKLSDLAGHGIQPDRPGIEEPVAIVIGKREKQVHSEWKSSDKDWRASLEIVGSVMCASPIPTGVIKQVPRSSIYD